MPLTDMEIRTAKPGPRLVKLSDGGGLQLWIMPDGAKRWRLAYRFAGVRKVLAVGVYPAKGFGAARRGTTPKSFWRWSSPFAGQKDWPSSRKPPLPRTRSTPSPPSFWKRSAGRQKAERTIVKFEWLMSLARPDIGARPIAEITSPEILAVLRPVEARGRHETAGGFARCDRRVFRYAVATGRAESDPTGALKGRSPRRPSSIAPRLSSRRPSADSCAPSQAMRAAGNAGRARIARPDFRAPWRASGGGMGGI